MTHAIQKNLVDSQKSTVWCALYEVLPKNYETGHSAQTPHPNFYRGVHRLGITAPSGVGFQHVCGGYSDLFTVEFSELPISVSNDFALDFALS